MDASKTSKDEPQCHNLLGVEKLERPNCTVVGGSARSGLMIMIKTNNNHNNNNTTILLHHHYYYYYYFYYYYY